MQGAISKEVQHDIIEIRLASDVNANLEIKRAKIV